MNNKCVLSHGLTMKLILMNGSIDLNDYPGPMTPDGLHLYVP